MVSPIVACHHAILVAQPAPAHRVRCKLCQLTITESELDGGPCPECQEARGERNYEFEPVVEAAAPMRYRCEACGLLVET